MGGISSQIVQFRPTLCSHLLQFFWLNEHEKTLENEATLLVHSEAFSGEFV